MIKRWTAIATKKDFFRPVRNTYTRNKPLPLHSHDYYEITWIDKGLAHHNINCSKTYLKPGSLIFIRAKDRHELLPLTNETLELTNIAFQASIFDSLCLRYPKEINWAFNHGKNIFQLDIANRARANKWADELFFSTRKNAFPIDRFILNLISQIQLEKKPSSPPKTPEWLTHAKLEMQNPKFFCQGPSAFFRLTQHSREHSSRALKHFFGITPSQFIFNARMEFAAQQLEMSTRTILDISLECGYKDLGHFYKAFRLKFGTTPRSYRMSLNI